MKVDLIIKNARIDTQNKRNPLARSVAVLNGRIVALDSDVKGLHARETFDAQGMTLLPGFNDVHTHSVWFGMTLMEADLSAVTSVEQIYQKIQQQAQKETSTEWIIASGYNPVLLDGAVPNKDELDSASGGRPVWIKHASGHSGQASAAALTLAGITKGNLPKIDGGKVLLDNNGDPTGVLEERAMELIQDILLPERIDKIELALGLATAQYAREGLTSVSDAGVAGGWIGHAPAELAAYQRAFDTSKLRTRIQVMPVLDALDEMPSHKSEPVLRGLGAGMHTGWGNSWLQLGPVKVFTDGSILGRTAQMKDSYVGCPGYHGYLQGDADTMRSQILEAAAAGWSLALHAVGDAALDFALDILEDAQERYGKPLVPNRVEHGVVVRTEQLARLAELNIACVVQPSFIHNFGEGIRQPIGEDRTQLSIPARRQLELGMPLALSSDRPVVPGSPLAGIQSFVERLSDQGEEFGPGERISVKEALHAATVGSAQVTGQEKDKGSIVEGKLADFVLLESNPHRVTASEIRDIPVKATLVGGSFTHRDEDVC